ncbi:zinc ribbon domain-containing protein [Lentilactobacillus sunkii]|uniref:zinc ribbon domain-containing protein n=1 Tax=Lentilactobacillus sunkii TaxID=481719 RepID=UPI000709D2B1|nr:zinc ribbon domain-containing protein [Lentilactobacillus sunkii]
MNEATKFCISCGKQIPSAAQFCPYCGKEQVSLSDDNSSKPNLIKQSTAPEPQRHSPANLDHKQLWYKNWMIWAIIILGVGLVTCIAMLNNARTTVVMQPAASSKAKKKDIAVKKKDPNEIPSDSLTHPSKVGQWKNSPIIGKATLIGLGAKPNTTIKDGPLSIKFKHAEVDKVHANTEDQLEQASDTFSKDNMPKDYNRIKIEYIVKNNSNRAIQFGGIKQVVYSNGYQTNFDDDSMSDTGSTDEISSNAKRVEYALILLGKSTTALKPSSIKILTDESEDAKSYDTVADGITFSEDILYHG